MGQPYSNDLRCKGLESYEVAGRSLRALAAQFRVSWGYTKKIRTQQVRTGQKERPPQSHHGPVSKITEAVKDRIRCWLGQQPDLTLAELGERLQATGVSVSRSRVGQVLQEMALGRKKNRSTRKSATRRRTGNGAKSSTRISARSHRNG